jgi:hypothetical protein
MGKVEGWLGLNRSDRRLAALLLVVALLGLAAGAFIRVTRGRADVTGFRVAAFPDGPVLRLSASDDGCFSVAGPLGPTVVEVRQGKARLVESGCAEPSWHGGWLSRPGQWSACAPNRVVLEVLGGSGEERFDAETR